MHLLAELLCIDALHGVLQFADQVRAVADELAGQLMQEIGAAKLLQFPERRYVDGRRMAGGRQVIESRRVAKGRRMGRAVCCGEIVQPGEQALWLDRLADTGDHACFLAALARSDGHIGGQRDHRHALFRRD